MIILGCGYVGAALAREALAAGEPVAALTRNVAHAAELRALGVAPVAVADVASEDWHGALNPSGQAVVFCVSPSSSGVEGYRHSFLDGAKSLALWLAKSAEAGRAPARELLFTSSTGVYPQADGGWVDENTPFDAAALSPTGGILRDAEKFLLGLPRAQAARAWVLRLGGLYGPGRHHLLDALRAGETTFPGDGEHWVNLLHRDDAVGAIRACLAAAPEISGGIFNTVDDEPVRKRELVAWLAVALGKSADKLQFDEARAGRAGHRQSVNRRSPNRRIANIRLKKSLAYKLICPSYKVGYGKIPG